MAKMCGAPIHQSSGIYYNTFLILDKLQKNVGKYILKLTKIYLRDLSNCEEYLRKVLINYGE